MSFRRLPSEYPAGPRYVSPQTPLPAAVAATCVDRRRHRIAVILAVFFAAGSVAFFTARASGQVPYKSIPMHPALLDKETKALNEKVIKQVQTSTKNWVTTGKGSSKPANGYFVYYVPARMTEIPDGVKNISALVEETNALLSRAHRSPRPQIAQQLTGFIYAGMKRVAEGNYHPAARINAALILSRLDRSPANNRTRTPPVPLLATFPILMKLYQDENNTDGVRAAGLQGLHRHVVYGSPQIKDAYRTEITTAMTELLDSDPPAGRSARAHAYLQRFAVDILDVFSAKDDSALGIKLISISTEPKNPNLIAFYSASRIGAMGNELKGKVNTPEEVLKSWSTRVLGVFDQELARLAALERPKRVKDQPRKPEDFLENRTTTRPQRTMGGGTDMDMEDMMDGMDTNDMADGMDGMEGMDMGDLMGEMDMGGLGTGMQGMMGAGGGGKKAKPQPPEVLASRRKLNHILQQVHLGVTGAPSAGIPTKGVGGLLASVAEDKKDVVVEWVTAMEPIVTELNNEMLDDREKYVEGLEAQAAILRELVGIEEEAPALGGAAGAAAALGEAPAAAAEPNPAAPAAEGAPVDDLSSPPPDDGAPVDELAAP